MRIYSFEQYREGKFVTHIIDYQTPLEYICFGCGEEIKNFNYFDSKFVTDDGQYFICEHCNQKQINKAMRFNSLNGD